MDNSKKNRISLCSLREKGLYILTEENVYSLCWDIILSRLRRIETRERVKYESWIVQERIASKEKIEVLAIPCISKKEIQIYKIDLSFSIEEIYRSCVIEKYSLKMAMERTFRPSANMELVSRPVGFENSKRVRIERTEICSY